jgi:hypothetical protein
MYYFICPKVADWNAVNCKLSLNSSAWVKYFLDDE